MHIWSVYVLICVCVDLCLGIGLPLGNGLGEQLGKKKEREKNLADLSAYFAYKVFRDSFVWWRPLSALMCSEFIPVKKSKLPGTGSFFRSLQVIKNYFSIFIVWKLISFHKSTPMNFTLRHKFRPYTHNIYHQDQFHIEHPSTSMSPKGTIPFQLPNCSFACVFHLILAPYLHSLFYFLLKREYFEVGRYVFFSTFSNFIPLKWEQPQLFSSAYGEDKIPAYKLQQM